MTLQVSQTQEAPELISSLPKPNPLPALIPLVMGLFCPMLEPQRRNPRYPPLSVSHIPAHWIRLPQNGVPGECSSNGLRPGLCFGDSPQSMAHPATGLTHLWIFSKWLLIQSLLERLTIRPFCWPCQVPACSCVSCLLFSSCTRSRKELRPEMEAFCLTEPPTHGASAITGSLAGARKLPFPHPAAPQHQNKKEDPATEPECPDFD